MTHRQILSTDISSVDAYACIVTCEDASIGLDFANERLYERGYSVWRMRSQELCVPTLVRRRAHPLGELNPPSASPGSRRSLEEKPMSRSNGEVVSVRIIPNEKGNPPGKLADAEVIFEPEAGLLSGLKLIGFSVWERRTGGGRNVTFPARQYSVNGERRSFALLRPATGELSAQEAIRNAILEAYSRFEAQT
jgi:hypothetical protein